METKGKVALVTGGGVRVGQALSLGLAQAGAHVVVHYNRSAGPAEETAAQARQFGVEALPVRADLSKPETAADLARAALDHFGRVDILVHAASPFVRASLADMTLEVWRQPMAVVVESFVLLAQQLAPGMVQQGEGAIVAILDRGVFDPWPEFLAHSTAKSALWAVARSLSVALAPHVRVNGVVPGPILPPTGFSEQRYQTAASATLLKRWGSPQDLVDAMLFLIRSDYITGSALFVDGGEQWGPRPQR